MFFQIIKPTDKLLVSTFQRIVGIDLIQTCRIDQAEAEFGDVMFSLINAARLYKINPDNALERTNQKFIRRFNYLEEQTIQKGVNLKDMKLEEMDAVWDEAKRKGL